MQQPVTMTPQPAVISKRFGAFPAKIGAMLEHRLTKPMTLRSGRFLATGTKIHLDVQDITRHPEADGHTKWVCRFPDCRDHKWNSKKELLAAHADNRVLTKQEEVHLYHAVAELPGVEAKAEQKAKDGSIVSPAVEAKLPTVVLLSDEE